MSDRAAKFPLTVYVQWQAQDGQPTWKNLCVVYDNESLGWIERVLEQTGAVFKISNQKGQP